MWCIINCQFYLQLDEEELRDAVLLVFANKQDLPNALSASELTEKLKLNQVKRNVSVKISYFRSFHSWSRHWSISKVTSNPLLLSSLSKCA